MVPSGLHPETDSPMTYKGYTGTVEYSEEDGCLFGRIAGICDTISYEGRGGTSGSF